ncbi:23S rRNA (uracil(1939)-C(5))-methyltransferase RlmD [Pelotomaculum terephthalicicum JT]|uniref:23S rRNA (uracil(1939)-C(5))-methyltransferase RlmD n=1 Tax=Pelotomaculum TaxID=191373 RepID=UPI0009C729E9|nr:MULTISPECIES: 23S rRNA (uracil(1939)-C(5))-methyltransferase RlmD [Pelotomaculum]MCG9969353.1 23S rRNA (uracil(1939)-C(5))-methyltransferase RlmD [Pelotomaculum terephthalicicum JT]OPX86419.1 MAG: 23S rRNA (uracil-C(5))-methyltransferase RlmCD [Pelotomaculum sp. PtaB.Bin117]OPY62120.1 MAG: 23S rRNA (uracil-C(5))-methyltransferase RlmCD [Pelotomaculum sp. PtaU1.Bin065]
MITRLPLRIGENVAVEITGLTHGGDGVGRHMGVTVFVPLTVPGDKVIAEISEIKRNFARGKLKMICAGAQSRREPLCPVYARCGGCGLQQMAYEEQLKQKTRMVKDSLARISRLYEVEVKETIGTEYPWHYRNKASYHVEEKQGGVSLGFYERGTHRLVYNADEEGIARNGPRCLLVDEDLNKTAEVIETVLNKYRVEVYKHRRRRGLLRQVVLRKANATGECMAVLVTGPGEWPEEKTIAADLLKQLPALTSLIRNIHHGPEGIEMGLENRLLAGQEYMTDCIESLAFRISAASFYQVNPHQTPVLYNKALEYAGLTGGETVVDAYSGTGTIALFFAGHAGMVYGLEVVPGAVEDARENALLNGIKNAEFLHGEVEKLLPALATQGLRPDVVVLDPPRRGCRVAALEALADMEAPRVVYVSCDPGTLARDLGYLAGKGYAIEEVQPVDMFPWTTHVEAIVLLQRQKP